MTIDGRQFLDGELELSIGLLGEENTREDGDWGWLEEALLDLDSCTCSPGKPETQKKYTCIIFV